MRVVNYEDFLRDPHGTEPHLRPCVPQDVKLSQNNMKWSHASCPDCEQIDAETLRAVGADLHQGTYTASNREFRRLMTEHYRRTFPVWEDDYTERHGVSHADSAEANRI
mmetsp:Transcript_2225/g.6635  ORF Transcript_2225/g.6635 Transcript_2225/m.6635 type:complete len:109 (-) Transcript_2225:98-424(-)|eukprot:CAMPEP_0198733282 /NCGR_PEP_ID=MMETSP1475-20131203/44356_1 /TAXON_ID= ORGANISM="Unidentified sp., Strain CCMP1999" /NCGR_SAMPLE_ID=MMETSP1475 /ASSEMBLY_ACC=CAM_ASM_001111 /LENGTH=108 /DNA_ID=CAMNT_0044496559 /DNA_START=849 /DNA_END=1175 /DNA_ORIENTATION=+